MMSFISLYALTIAKATLVQLMQALQHNALMKYPVANTNWQSICLFGNCIQGVPGNACQRCQGTVHPDL